MALNDVIINQQSGGLGRVLPSADGTCGFLTNGVAVSGGVQLDTPYRLTTIDDLKPLQIDAAYDTTNKVLVYENIKDYFRVNQGKGELWLMLVDNTDKYDEMIENSTEKLVNASNGAIKMIAYSYNTDLAGIPVTPVDLDVAIGKTETVTEKLTTNHYPVSALLEMVGFKKNSIIDYRTKNVRRVSGVIAQNYATSQRADQVASERCAIGLALGTVSLALVHENIGWVQKFNVLGDNLQVASVDGTKVSELTDSEKNDFNDHGLLFLRQHVGIAGLYWNDSHTCTAATDDFAYIENNRVIDKATRLIRTALLPSLNSPVYVDPNTGELAPNVVARLENIGKKAITDQMLVQGEVSSFNFTIDPHQDILATSELVATLTIVPVGTARKITVNIGFSNPFNN